ncbi:TonB family protein [Alteromonadaceae bacterium BrNp21-10]|nr:TonB family protein [Alteromonadaceae bacterium BrNp21-10]
MQLHIFIATTQGLVAVQDIQDINDVDIHSLVSVNGTSTTANISGAYHQFVKKGAGIIQHDFGACSYRLNLSARIDHGNSWQLAVYLAHCAHRQNILGNGKVRPGDHVICATGEVNTRSRQIQAVEQVSLKLELASESIKNWQLQGIPVAMLLPEANWQDIQLAAYDYVMCIKDLEQAMATLPNLAASSAVSNQHAEWVSNAAQEDLISLNIQQIGKYKVLNELGAGGFGVVYLAEDPLLHSKVAIKVFQVRDANLAGQATSSSTDAIDVLKQRFIDEAKTLRSLSVNPYIVEMYEFDQLADGTPYYVMPFLSRSIIDEMGKDTFSQGALKELPLALHPRRIPVAKAKVYLQQLLEALVAVHEKGLVHRDIKPANLRLNSQGQLQLCDFGIAKLADSAFSQSGVGMGSRHYMSPEQRESAKHVLPSSDIYSVGVLAYRMLTGQLPSGRYQDPKHFAPEMGEPLNKLILRAIEQQPHKRPQHAAEMLSEFKKAITTVADVVLDEEDTGTWVGSSAEDIGRQWAPTVKAELIPLKQKITDILLEEGKIPEKQQFQLQALAAIAGLNDEQLALFIEDIKLQLTVQLAPLQHWLELAKSKIITNELDPASQKILLESAVNAGLSKVTAKRHLKELQQQFAASTVAAGLDSNSSSKSAAIASFKPKSNNKAKIGLVVILLLIAGGVAWQAGLLSSQNAQQQNVSVSADLEKATVDHTLTEFSSQQAIPNDSLVEIKEVDEPQPRNYPLAITTESSDTEVKMVNIDTTLPSTIENSRTNIETQPQPKQEPPVQTVRISPRYPMQAAREGIEGWVRLSFTIDEEGAVEDVKVIEAYPNGVFNKEATRAVIRWRFVPKIENGKSVKQFDQRTQLDFNLN